jgi:guanylate kinase
MQGKSIIFSAPSGTGKTTILKKLLEFPELNLEFSVSATTRKPRLNEVDGKDYYFLSVGDFKKRISENGLVEWQEVYENSLYGTLKTELNRIWNKGNNATFDVDVKGGLNLKKVFGKNALAIFIAPPSLKVLESRLRDRGTETDDNIQQRLAKANYEMSFKSQFDNTIINDVIENSVKQAYKIILEFIKK